MSTETKSGYTAQLYPDQTATDPRKDFLEEPTTEADRERYDAITEQWAEGEVYEYTITDVLTGEIVDSLCGMYGYEYALETMHEALEQQVGEPSAMEEAKRTLNQYAAELEQAGDDRAAYVEDLAERVTYVWG